MYNQVNIRDILDLKGKTAFVTGAAAGIGEGIVRRLHEAGANVVVADINQERADAVADELNHKRPESAISYAFDVGVAHEVNQAFEHAIQHFGAVDILVNNAGIYPFVTLADMTEEIFEKTINTNLKSVFLCTKVATDHMKATHNKGKVINITSIDAIHPSMAGLAHYDASKHGEWGFTKNVALELAPFGISVNAIAPGAISTPGTQGITVNPAAMEQMISRIPMARMGEADEIAKAVLFLASDLSSYMTGEQIVVDGGRLLG